MVFPAAHPRREGKAASEAEDGAPPIFPPDQGGAGEAEEDEEAPPMFYPMFLMNWMVMTALDVMTPHQVMLCREELTTLSDHMRGRIIFISHEWLSVAHPDPDGVQLRTLQSFLRDLASGRSAVENDWRTQLFFNSNECVTGPRWRATLPHCYFWLDYSGVPQHRKTKAMPYDAGDLPDGLMSDVGHTMELAVRSIPAYVAASSLMMILAPTVEHADDAGRICDIPSWRRRGWCRMEAYCAILAKRRLRLMNVIGPAVSGHFLCPVSLIYNPPGLGDFTCCSLGHVREGRKIPCDKVHLRGAMECLLSAYVEHAWRAGRTDMMRLVICSSECWLSGLPARPDTPPPPSKLDLEAFREALRWRELASCRPSRRCCGAAPQPKWTLLHWAAMAGNAGAVRDLILEDDGDLQAKATAIPELGASALNTPLHLACFASSGTFDAAAVLLDARADPCARSEVGHTPAHTVAMCGSLTQLKQWFSRLPESVNSTDLLFGATPLFMSIGSMYPCADRFKVLRDFGADVHASSSMLGKESIWFGACGTFCPDVEVIRALLEARCMPDAVIEPENPRWRSTFFLAEKAAGFSEWRGHKPSHMIEFLAQTRGSTPLHAAIAQSASLEVVRLLLEARAPAQHRNRMGRTPLQEADRTFGGEPPELLASLLREHAALQDACIEWPFAEPPA